MPRVQEKLLDRYVRVLEGLKKREKRRYANARVPSDARSEAFIDYVKAKDAIERRIGAALGYEPNRYHLNYGYGIGNEWPRVEGKADKYGRLVALDNYRYVKRADNPSGDMGMWGRAKRMNELDPEVRKEVLEQLGRTEDDYRAYFGPWDE